MEKTAVDWYEKEINSLFEKYEAKQISRADFLIMKHNLFYPAKKMEKQQIKDAYQVVDLDIQHEDVGEINSEQYYNETYE